MASPGTSSQLWNSAQRLTASEVSTLDARFPFHPVILVVLNALRHQRNPHKMLVYRIFLHCSAQRLTASEVSTLELDAPPLDTHLVLNALRHQRNPHLPGRVFSPPSARCSTPYGIRGICRIRTVSNTAAMSLCSTPYGIRGHFHMSVQSGGLIETHRGSSSGGSESKLSSSRICPHLVPLEPT